MRPAARLTVGFAAVASLLVACQILVGVKDEDENPRPTPSTDAGADTQVGDAMANGDPCPHALPPREPAPGEARPTNTHYFAVRRIRLGGFDEFDKSYDFDGVCTCDNKDTRPEARTPSCIPAAQDPCGSTKSDDPKGRDLGGANAFNLARFGGDNIDKVEQNDVNSKFQDGLLGFVIGLTSYNDSPNDPDVSLSFAVSAGIETTGDAGKFRPDAEACAALNDAQVFPSDSGARDKWYFPRGIIEGRTGFVRDGTLVVDNRGSVYSLPIGGLIIRQSDPIFQAKISKPDGGSGYVLRGNLVGLVDANNIVSVIGSFRGDPDGGRLCDNQFAIGAFQGVVCSARDLRIGGADPSIGCNAFALAIGVEAYEVDKGSELTCPELTPELCDASCPTIPAK